MNNIERYTEKTFDDIKHVDEKGNEYWEARELQKVLGYKEWRYFSVIIEKAQIACINSNNNPNNDFGVYTKIGTYVISALRTCNLSLFNNS